MAQPREDPQAEAVYLPQNEGLYYFFFDIIISVSKPLTATLTTPLATGPSAVALPLPQINHASEDKTESQSENDKAGPSSTGPVFYYLQWPNT